MMMQKQVCSADLKSKIPTWQSKLKTTNNKDKDGLDQIRFKTKVENSNNENTLSSSSLSSSSSLMSIRADTQVKQQAFSQTQLITKTSLSLKPKSKLYKSSIIENKKIPSFRAKIISTNSTDRKPLHNNLPNDIDKGQNLTNSKENQVPNQNEKFLQTNKYGFKASKILKENNNLTKMENEKNLKNEKTNEENPIYQKVYLSKKRIITKEPRVVCKQDDSSKSIVDNSIETLKESINVFKKKFTSNVSNGIKSSNLEEINMAHSYQESKSLDKQNEPISDSTIVDSIQKQDEVSSESEKTIDIEKSNTNSKAKVFLKTDSLKSRKHNFSSKLPTTSRNFCANTLDLNDSTGKQELKYKAQTMNKDKGDISPPKTIIRSKADLCSKENRSQSQEEILEEFKNSLNELIKASKWTNESQNQRNSRNYLSLYGTSLNIDDYDTHESKIDHENQIKGSMLRKSTTLIDSQILNNNYDDNNNNNNKSLNFKNHTFSIDKSKSSEYLKLSSSSKPSDLNTSLCIQTPQATKQLDSIGNQIVSPLSLTPSALNNSLSYSSDSTKSSLINIRSTSSNNLNDSSSSTSSSTLQQHSNKQYDQNLLTNKNKNSIKQKSAYRPKEEKNFDQFQNNKRFSTTSEILTKKASNQDLIDKKISTFHSNLTSVNRKSIPTLSTSESVSSFQSIETNYTNPYNVVMHSIDSRRYSDMKNTTEKSMNKIDIASSTSIVQPIRKSANSWLAQSFRKAFSKIDKRKINKSQSHLNHINKNATSTLSINCHEIDAQKCHSDEENETNYKHHKNLLTQSSHDCLNDSESDYEDDKIKNSEYLSKNSKNLIMTKRSYRSESELAFKNLKHKEMNSNQINKTSNLITINNNMSKIHEGKICSKLSKNHKSVSSLLTTSNSTNQILEQMNTRHKQNLVIQESSPSSPQNSQKFTNKCNCKLNESMVTDLKKKLTTAENKLTDIRLEALSSVHQIDQLKECIDKMKDEMIELKSENNLLKKYIRETKCEKVDLSNQQKMLENFDECDEKCELSKKITEMFQYINLNMSNYYYSYNFLLSDENETLLRKALVTIDCSYQLKFSQEKDDQHINSYRICNINIDSKLKWPLMDGIVSYVFKRYINKIDPNKSIGLDQYSIDGYQIGDINRKINDSKYPDLLPFGYLIGNNCVIKIILKDNRNQLDSLSYETLIPKYLLEDYVDILVKNRLIAINSMFKFGKTYLMYKMSQFLCKNSDENFEIFYLNIDELTGHYISNIPSSNVNFFEILTSKIDEKLSYLKHLDQSLIVLLDNFHLLFNKPDNFNSLEFLNYIIRVKNKYRVYFIITCNESYSECNSKSIQIPIDFYHDFKWINLSLNYSEFLQFYLKRYLINFQVDNNKIKDSCAIMEKVVWYVGEVYKLVNDFILKLELNDFVLTPFNFMNIPFGADLSEKWFIELWNYTIIPYLNDLFKIKLIENEASSAIIKHNDPIDWVIKYYVWSKNSNSKPLNQRLLKIKINENYLTKGFRSSSSSNDSDLNNSTEFQMCTNETGTHLVSMLLKLQKATSLTKEENLSSGFYDSSSSSSSSTSSTSPNCNIRQNTNLLFASLINKNKIESSL